MQEAYLDNCKLARMLVNTANISLLHFVHHRCSIFIIVNRDKNLNIFLREDKYNGK